MKVLFYRFIYNTIECCLYSLNRSIYNIYNSSNTCGIEYYYVFDNDNAFDYLMYDFIPESEFYDN